MENTNLNLSEDEEYELINSRGGARIIVNKKPIEISSSGLICHNCCHQSLNKAKCTLFHEPLIEVKSKMGKYTYVGRAIRCLIAEGYFLRNSC